MAFKNPITKMPWGLRVAFGIFVALLFGLAGASFWEQSRLVACILLGLAALRLYSAGRLAAWYLSAPDEGEQLPPEEHPEAKGIPWDDVERELEG